MKTLTVSMQRYISAVYELSSDEGTRVSDIAAKLEVTKASACVAMKNLQEKGLVYRDGLRQVFLTNEGRYQAALMLDKYAIIYRFLIDILKVDQEVAKTDAYAMGCVISVNSVCAICRSKDPKHQCQKACTVYLSLGQID